VPTNTSNSGIKRGGGANVLTEDIVSNFGEMAAFGETRVTLEPVA
jgi:hypothetical protein